MLKKIALLTILIGYIVSAQAQGFKFGVHVSPIISFLDSDKPYVGNTAVAGAVALGVEVERYFSDGENYALTFGVDFSLGKGGTLLYEYGGKFLGSTDLYENPFANNTTGEEPSSGTDLHISAFTPIKYSVTYIELPIGLKLRTNELGGSYMRAFFHLPLIKIMVPVIAQARIYTPDTKADGYVKDLNPVAYSIPEETKSSLEKNVYGEILPIQIAIGAGAGVEYTPNAEGGLRLFAGIYYDYGLLDVVSRKKINYEEAWTDPNTAGDIDQEINPRNALHNISLRIGVTF
ncbi:MAG: PorT family protein [Aureispira sp.]|nr:PorT family protein [Aureispira sp.]